MQNNHSHAVARTLPGPGAPRARRAQADLRRLRNVLRTESHRHNRTDTERRRSGVRRTERHLRQFSVSETRTVHSREQERVYQESAVHDDSQPQQGPELSPGSTFNSATSFFSFSLSWTLILV